MIILLTILLIISLHLNIRHWLRPPMMPPPPPLPPQPKPEAVPPLQHDLRTSLHAAIGFCELLQDQDLPADQLHSYLNALNTSCRQLLVTPGLTQQVDGDSSNRFTPLAPAPRILIVDDTPINLQVLSCMLQRLHVPYTACATGAEALTHLQKTRFDLVLTDIRMPAMDGLELCHRIKTDPHTALTPVCALTAEPAIGPNLFDRILHKPLTLAKLRSFLMESGGKTQQHA